MKRNELARGERELRGWCAMIRRERVEGLSGGWALSASWKSGGERIFYTLAECRRAAAWRRENTARYGGGWKNGD